MDLQTIVIMHYSVAPVVGGVESVIQAHASLFLEKGFNTIIVAGKGNKDSLPAGVEYIEIPELDSQNARTVQMAQELEQGHVPADFDVMTTKLLDALSPVVDSRTLIAHNVFTKHFNLPLTAALFQLLDQKKVARCIAWCHDFTWTSPTSRSKVFPGYPWDLLRTYRSDVTYATVSQQRQRELAGLFECPDDLIRVVYNGIDQGKLLGISDTGMALMDRLELWGSDLILLMPVRVTRAKNMELAIKVTAALKAQNVRVKLIVTGPPDPHDPKNMEYFRGLQNLRDELGVTNEMRFVYESGVDQGAGLILEMSAVGELFRASDVLFMPSHREGFGMPVLEAGLIGMPIFCADPVPAAREIGGQDINSFALDADPNQVAGLILKWMETSSILHLRRKIRSKLTWRSIFKRSILPLLNLGDV